MSPQRPPGSRPPASAGGGEPAEIVEAAVHRWWVAWAAKDLDTILTMALPEYVEFTGHSAEHRVGRDTLEAVAGRAFEAFSIRSWTVGTPTVRRVGAVAIACYGWTQRADRGGTIVESTGVATDVLVLRDRAWRYLAHHSSTTEDA